MYAFKVPDIGEGVVEAEILQWHVSEGDQVSEDQLLVELLTDKAEIEIPSPRAGRIVRLHFAVGETARVGDVLIEIEEGGKATGEAQRATSASKSDASASASAESASGSQRASAESSEPVVERSKPRAADTARKAPPQPVRSTASKARGGDVTATPSSASEAAHRPPPMPARPRGRGVEAAAPLARPAGPVQAVPAVRELAKRLGIDLTRVRGTGPRGRIMRRDVEAHASGDTADAPSIAAPSAMEAPADPSDWVRQPLRGLRRTIAERMSRSRRTAAHFTYADEIDMTALLDAVQERKSDGLSPLAFIARAAVTALADFPILNASIDDARGEIVLKGAIHLGVAAATDNGLLVPVIRDADQLDVPALAEQIRRLAEGARAGSLSPAELRGSTFTITSLGKLGGVISTPILNPPEVGILGVNAIRALPRVIDGGIVPRRVMNLSISVDHRIADGIVAAQYIQAMRSLLEAPASLLRDIDHA